MPTLGFLGINHVVNTAVRLTKPSDDHRHVCKTCFEAAQNTSNYCGLHADDVYFQQTFNSGALQRCKFVVSGSEETAEFEYHFPYPTLDILRC
ncbi:hypothetical protein PISMIDRAFT_687645 [Pisolithus microcarpus 441]|uniref:Unplaced genomic scaffold scaffold_237, whole genome shotgun sequence n=1 Tax=Pisolithus microcarpus 441 TaxID=765257 RepID=A0A0C9XR95_9AGAM|nr:hypothetical protein PISMIDRAFT_687645 [Pisolithus microcarpus 441]